MSILEEGKEKDTKFCMPLWLFSYYWFKTIQGLKTKQSGSGCSFVSHVYIACRRHWVAPPRDRDREDVREGKKDSGKEEERKQKNYAINKCWIDEMNDDNFIEEPCIIINNRVPEVILLA